MASRHLSRAHVLQTLFECDSQGGCSVETARAVLERNVNDFSDGDTSSAKAGADSPFADTLLQGVLAKQEEIDRVIVASAPDWPLDRIASIDRNILRIGLFELLFANKGEVPPKVALNEAIELAKAYGSDSSAKFVNGVLGAVYKSMGNPGKDDTPKDPKPLPHEHFGGALLARARDEVIEIAFVLDAFNRWTFPKSKCVEGELSNSAALRALQEDFGIDAELKTPLGEHEYIAHEPEKGRVVRTVGFFLAIVPENTELTPHLSSSVKDARWFSESVLGTMSVYEDQRAVIEAGFLEAKHLCL